MNGLKMKITKKQLNKLRKSAKEQGMKIKAEYGEDGLYHVYVYNKNVKRIVL